MLRDAAKRFLADNCSTKFVRQMMADETAHDAGFWRKLVDLGWPGLLIPEEYGGQGGTFLDMTVIAEEAGKALVPGPFFAAALLGAPIVIEGGSDAQKKELLPKMAKGEYHRDRRDRRGRGPFRRGRNRAEGEQEGRRLHAHRRKVFRARRARRQRYRGRGAHRRQRRGRHHAADGTGQAKGRHHHPAQDRRYDAAAVPREVRQRDSAGRELARQGRRGMADPAPHARYRYRRAVGRDGRHRAEGARYVGRLRQDARAVRQADRIVPGGQAQVRRHDGRGRERALADLLRVLDGRRSAWPKPQPRCRWRRRTPPTWRRT